jgi:hypothetical protein
MLKKSLLVSLSVCFVMAQTIFAAVPLKIVHSGRLMNSQGIPVNGNSKIEFRIYDDPTAGTLKWSEVQNPVPVTNGIYSVAMGSNTAIGVTVFDGTDRYLETWVNDEKLSPRVPLSSVAHAYLSEKAYYLTGSTICTVNGNVGIGTTNPGGLLDVGISFFTSPGAITIKPQSGANNGGNLYFTGAGSNKYFYIDNNAGRLRIITQDTVGESEKLTVLNNGYVGIGTSNPVGHFATRRALIIADTTNDAVLELWGTASGKAYMQSVAGNAYIGNLAKGSGNGFTQLFYGDGIVSLTIKGADGNVGIGITNPGAKLEAANIKIGEGLEVDGYTPGTDTAGMWFYVGDGTNAHYKLCYFDVWKDGASVSHVRLIGTLNQASEQVYVTCSGSGGWVNGCSRKIKHDIKQLTVADCSKLTGQFDNLTLYAYKRNDDSTNSPEVGFISEETPDIMGSVDTKYISYIKAIGFLNVVAKNNIGKLDDLETRVSELENKFK